MLEQVPAADGDAHLENVLTEKGRGLYLVLMAISVRSDGLLSIAR